MDLLVLNEADVRALLPMDACIEVMAGALAAFARGEVHQPLRTIVRPPGAAGLMGLMPSWIGRRGGSAYGLKAICVFHGNPAIGKDAHQGAVLLFSGETGEPLAVINASAVTGIRTAAVSGLAARLLAREDAGDLAIVGAGVQARAHLEAMRSVRPLRRVRVASRAVEHALELAREVHGRYPFPVEAVPTPKDAVRDADLVVLATTAFEPLVRREWIAPGAHVTAVGAYTPTTREVDSATIAAARVFVDSREAALRDAGDALIPIREGALVPEDLAEIGEVLIGRRPGRRDAGQITVFKSLGLAVEDLAAAEYLHLRARETGAGTTVPF